MYLNHEMTPDSQIYMKLWEQLCDDIWGFHVGEYSYASSGFQNQNTRCCNPKDTNWDTYLSVTAILCLKYTWNICIIFLDIFEGNIFL
jgi:hypothetical protein